jgi:hypothetical protein
MHLGDTATQISHTAFLHKSCQLAPARALCLLYHAPHHTPLVIRRKFPVEAPEKAYWRIKRQNQSGAMDFGFSTQYPGLHK